MSPWSPWVFRRSCTSSVPDVRETRQQRYRMDHEVRTLRDGRRCHEEAETNMIKRSRKLSRVWHRPNTTRRAFMWRRPG